MELLSLLLPLLDDEPEVDFADFESDDLLLVLEPDLAFGVDDLDSEPEDLLPLLDVEDEPKPEDEEEPEPIPIPLWLLEPIPPWLPEDPMPLWLPEEPIPLWLEEEPISEPLLFEVPDEEPPDELPDWLDD